MEGGGLSKSLTYGSRQSDGSGGYGDWQMSGLTWRECTDAGDMCDAEKRLISLCISGEVQWGGDVIAVC